MVDLFEEKDIVNKEYYEGVKDKINCSICLNIIKDPVQCDKCQKFFCSDCIKEVEECPFRCKNNNYTSGLLCRQLISELKIKCECGKVIGFDHIQKHKEEECEKADFKKSYFNLKKKYELLKKELNKKDDEVKELKSSYFIKSSAHKHPIEVLRRFGNKWFCDECNKFFEEDIPSYHCTLCDFDICYDCAKDKVTLGNISLNMERFYE